MSRSFTENVEKTVTFNWRWRTRDNRNNLYTLAQTTTYPFNSPNFIWSVCKTQSSDLQILANQYLQNSAVWFGLQDLKFQYFQTSFNVFEIAGSNLTVQIQIPTSHSTVKIARVELMQILHSEQSLSVSEIARLDLKIFLPIHYWSILLY